MNDEAYTNLDLDTAEELLIAAGRPELAKALRYQAQGVRNLVQGEWGQSFVNTLDSMLALHLQPIAKEMAALRSEVATRLGKLEKATALLKKGQQRISSEVNTLGEEVSELRGSHDAQNTRHEAQIREITDRLERKRERFDRDEERIEENERQIAELRQIITDRQIQRPIEYEQLADAIVERLKARGDGGD